MSDAKQLSKDDVRHEPRLTFYNAIGIQEAYYWFVLDNATADQVHWLTPEELLEFDFTDKLLPEEDFIN